MFIGERCAFDECHREDFLPFKCSDCRQHYCSNHFRPQTHRCSHYNESDVDYRVPLCPICDNPPEGWKRDQDPNIAMDRHLSGQCPKLDSNGYLKSNASIPSSAPLKQMSRAKKPNECSFVKCTKIMVKGILSEADKLKLAEEMAALSKTERMKASDSDCVII
uniref:AN1-type domain-containing protein n=1 Tax=Kalmanozyma brasiliensis (strain GHG001) TaxID=1365824 RepID=V5F0G0_KALBG